MHDIFIYMELSLVIPSYGKASTICREIQQLDTYLQRIVSSYEIILVIDGDYDGTYEQVARELHHIASLSVIRFAANQGKGVAVTSGFAQARGQYVCTLDAGGDIDFQYLAIMLQVMKLQHADIVIGSKRNTLSVVSYTPLRYLYSMLYQMLNQLLFGLHVKDTQVGFKLFKKEVIDAILPHLATKAFAFDVEMLVVATLLGYKKIVEAPTRITYEFHSTINVWAVTTIIYDTFRIFYRYRLRPRHLVARSQPLSPAMHITRIPESLTRERVRS